jgi:hypothetical protein
MGFVFFYYICLSDETLVPPNGGTPQVVGEKAAPPNGGAGSKINNT